MVGRASPFSLRNWTEQKKTHVCSYLFFVCLVDDMGIYHFCYDLSCAVIWYNNTVEPPIKDPPRQEQPLYKGQNCCPQIDIAARLAHAHKFRVWQRCITVRSSPLLGRASQQGKSRARGMSVSAAGTLLLLVGVLAGYAAEEHVLDWTVEGVDKYRE